MALFLSINSWVKLSLLSSFPRNAIHWHPKNCRHSIVTFKYWRSLDLYYRISLFINSAMSPNFDTVTWFFSVALWHLESSWLLKHFSAFFQSLKPVEICVVSLLCSTKTLSLCKAKYPTESNCRGLIRWVFSKWCS